MLIGTPTADRLFQVADAMRTGMTEAEVHARTMIDPWFLAQIGRILDALEKSGQADNTWIFFTR